jgi:hypothetical protein
MTDDKIIKIDAVELYFFKDKTVVECADGDLYEIQPVMFDGSRMVLEFFHNQVFPTSNDRLFGVEGGKAMRN